MGHKHRIIDTLSHKQPDRIPFDLGSTRDSSIVVEGYEKIKKYYNVDEGNILIDKMMRVVKIDENILERLDIDTRGVFPGTLVCDDKDLSEIKYTDSWGIEREKLENSYYYDQVKFPLSGNISKWDIFKYNWPVPDDPVYTKNINEEIDKIINNTDYAVVLSLPSPFIHISQYLRGFEDWYCDFLSNLKVINILFDSVLEINMAIAKNILKESGQSADIIFCADDLGTQNGLQISKELYLKHIKPRHKRYFDQIHNLSRGKLLFHSCGSISTILKDLLEPDLTESGTTFPLRSCLRAPVP